MPNILGIFLQALLTIY